MLGLSFALEIYRLSSDKYVYLFTVHFLF